MIDQERLDDIWASIIGYEGAKKVVITKPEVLIDDVAWMIQIIKDQQEELAAWRNEGMI